jgi:hypothetical protein
MGLASPNSGSDPDWSNWWSGNDQGSWTWNNKKYGTDTDMEATKIVCAVNTFSQDTVYKISGNALCALQQSTKTYSGECPCAPLPPLIP